MKTLLILTASAVLAACATPQEDCKAPYPIEIDIGQGSMIYSLLVQMIGEDTVNQQRGMIKADLSCTLSWSSVSAKLSRSCTGEDLQTEKHIEATPEQARDLIGAFNLAEVPKAGHNDVLEAYYVLNIQCQEEDCSVVVAPICWP